MLWELQGKINATHRATRRERDVEFYRATRRERDVEFYRTHNQPHKYLGLKINLSELLQSSVKSRPQNAPHGKRSAELYLSRPKHRPIGRCLLSSGSVVPEFPLILGGGENNSISLSTGREIGGKAREIFLYQKIILLASKK